MYQPTLGRFLSQDPLGPDGVDVLFDNNAYGAALDRMRNLYGYCGNNPMNCVDPSGLVPFPMRNCGPDVTAWFGKEVAIWQAAARAFEQRFLEMERAVLRTNRTAIPLLTFKLNWFREIGPKPDYKDPTKWPFASSGCPNACPNTVTLAGTCVGTNQLGNVIYGILAQEVDLVAEARAYVQGRYSLLIGAPDPLWNAPGEAYRQTAMDIGVQYAATGQYAGLMNMNPGAPVGGGPFTLSCAPCSAKWDGPHSDPNAARNPNIDPQGNLKK